MTASTEPRVRIARHAAACGAPGCTTAIWPGSPIIQPPGGGAWRHADCTRPGKRTQAHRDAERTAPASRRRR